MTTRLLRILLILQSTMIFFYCSSADKINENTPKDTVIYNSAHPDYIDMNNNTLPGLTSTTVLTQEIETSSISLELITVPIVSPTDVVVYHVSYKLGRSYPQIWVNLTAPNYIEYLSDRCWHFYNLQAGSYEMNISARISKNAPHNTIISTEAILLCIDEKNRTSMFMSNSVKITVNTPVIKVYILCSEAKVTLSSTIHYEIQCYNTGSTARDLWLNVTLDPYTYYFESSFGKYDVTNHAVYWHFRNVNAGHFILYLNITLEENTPNGTFIRHFVTATYTCENGFELPHKTSNIVSTMVTVHAPVENRWEFVLVALPFFELCVLLILGYAKKNRKKHKIRKL